jgi:hypothetical protein
MGFSLFGQFAATIILLQTAPIGFAQVGWKYFLVVICWCIVFIPGVQTLQLSTLLLTKNRQLYISISRRLHG